jgi:hypothetical protein
MNLITNHINKHLDSFISNYHGNFGEIFVSIQSTSKNLYKSFLLYVNNILEEILTKESTTINYLHLHFEKDLNMIERNLILEFLIIKFFINGLKEDVSSEENESLAQYKSSLQFAFDIISRTCPEGASGKKGGNRKFKKWISEKKFKKEELDFYNSIPNTKSLVPKTIVNTLVKYNDCLDMFKAKHFGIKLEEMERFKSYVIFNKEKTLYEIDTIDDFVDNLDNIILFNCESKSTFINYNINELTEWNNDGTRFKNCFIFTFGRKKVNINSLKNISAQVDFKYKTSKDNSYTITNFEINKLLKRNMQNQIKIDLFESESNIFWDKFVLESKIHDNLYELISIKMMNVFSLTINDNIKNLILQDIFEKTNKNIFISDDTKQEIPEELKPVLKEALSNTLDYIIHSNWKDEIQKSINKDTILVVPEQFVNNAELIKELKIGLNLSFSNKIITWKSIKPNLSENLLILNYLDSGHFPYYFYPNIIELESSNSKGLFLNFFFNNKYHWASYNSNNDYYNLLNHQIRSDAFKWNSLKQSILKLKPTYREKTHWDIESSYVNSGNQDIIKIKLVDSPSSHNYHSSDLFICRVDNTLILVRANELFNYILPEIEIQCLNEITSALPIYEKLADINKQEEELEIIRHKFELDKGEDAGRLWKILLKRKADIIGSEKLYLEIKELFLLKNLRIVSFNHFKNNWINPDSSSLSPLMNKMFAYICEYLELPITYNRLIHRIKAKTKQASRINTIKIHNLYKDLFDDNCFDDISKTREILENKYDYYIMNHSLEELGIDEDYLIENLIALVELINPEITLKKIESMESINQ